MKKIYYVGLFMALFGFFGGCEWLASITNYVGFNTVTQDGVFALIGGVIILLGFEILSLE